MENSSKIKSLRSFSQNGYLLQSPQPKIQSAKAEVKLDELTFDRPSGVSTLNTQPSQGELSFRVMVREGEIAKIGMPLVEIDPAPYQFALDQAQVLVQNRVALAASPSQVFDAARISRRSSNNGCLFFQGKFCLKVSHSHCRPTAC